MKFLEHLSGFVGKTFAIWVILFAVIAYYFPDSSTWIGPYIPILLGIIMFGMGLTLTPGDFKAIFKSPKSVIIGVLAQFIIMPSLAFLLAKLFGLSAELAVGVILVGCCPGGTASNVMTYLAKGNTALSVTITTCSTLLAPILTPLLILLFASQWLDISAGSMLFSILKIVLLPIVGGIVIRSLFKKQVEKSIGVLPLISVVGIVLVVMAVIALNTGNIATSGWLIFLVVILHNGMGLLLGFLAGKVLNLSFSDQKAISIEVGMQNSGLAAALATVYFSPIAALPSAIFSVWHNISGPLLATYWSKEKKHG